MFRRKTSVLIGILLFVGSFCASAQQIYPQIEIPRTELDSIVSNITLYPAPVSEYQKIKNEIPLVRDLIRYAYQFEGRPYRRGSKGPQSFDCSGFTSYVFNRFSIRLNSSSSTQYQQGSSIKKAEMKPGDLVFFKGRNSSSTRVGHVGVVSKVFTDGTFKFIHASCSQGVCEEHSTAPYYVSRYIGARRVFDDKGKNPFKM